MCSDYVLPHLCTWIGQRTPQKKAEENKHQNRDSNKSDTKHVRLSSLFLDVQTISGSTAGVLKLSLPRPYVVGPLFRQEESSDSLASLSSKLSLVRARLLILAWWLHFSSSRVCAVLGNGLLIPRNTFFRTSFTKVTTSMIEVHCKGEKRILAAKETTEISPRNFSAVSRTNQIKPTTI